LQEIERHFGEYSRNLSKSYAFLSVWFEVEFLDRAISKMETKSRKFVNYSPNKKTNS
jgi:hypothetical protein